MQITKSNFHAKFVLISSTRYKKNMKLTHVLFDNHFSLASEQYIISERVIVLRKTDF